MGNPPPNHQTRFGSKPPVGGNSDSPEGMPPVGRISAAFRQGPVLSFGLVGVWIFPVQDNDSTDGRNAALRSHGPFQGV